MGYTGRKAPREGREQPDWMQSSVLRGDETNMQKNPKMARVSFETKHICLQEQYALTPGLRRDCGGPSWGLLRPAGRAFSLRSTWD